jgi:hypothetical protein
MEADLIDQLFNSSEKRLARVLLLLAKFDSKGGPQMIIDKINQETLADLIGTTRSRVNSFMNKFRRLGFIAYDGHEITVYRSLLSVVLNDDKHSLETLKVSAAKAASPASISVKEDLPKGHPNAPERSSCRTARQGLTTTRGETLWTTALYPLT